MTDKPVSFEKFLAALASVFLVGGYLIALASAAILTGRWPVWFTLIQFDAIHVVLSLFGTRFGTYAAGAILGILGLLLWGVCVVMSIRRARST